MAGVSANVALALEALALRDRCSQCGKQDAAVLRRCSRCKQASYCGAACQNAAWKGHKKLCATLEEVFGHVCKAITAASWRGVLKWEGRMEEMMLDKTDAACLDILTTFNNAHRSGFSPTFNQHHFLASTTLYDRMIELLGKMERFRDQGEMMCLVVSHLGLGDAERRDKEADKYLQKARKVAEAHGFFSVECRACHGLGEVSMREGRHAEGVELLRNALIGYTRNPAQQALYPSHLSPTLEAKPSRNLQKGGAGPWEASTRTQGVSELELTTPAS